MHVVIMQVDDWEGLYIDDELIYENHNVTVDDLNDHTKGEEFTLEVIWCNPAAAEDVAETGSFPEMLTQLSIED